jgi:Xaa-Pro dipeptidase
MTTNAARALAASDCDELLVSDPATVTWLTGFAPDVIYGPSPFAAPPLAIVRRDGSVVAVVSADEAPGVTGCEVCEYEGFTTGPLDPLARQREALRSLPLDGRIGIEAGSLAVALAPEGAVDVTARLGRLRAVKTAAELERIRAAIRLCDAGQAAARAAYRAGIGELELWASIQAAVEAAAGERTPLLCDLVTGPRSAEVGGPPTQRIAEDGDLAIVDIVPRLAGYWGDSCSTLVAGEPPDGAREQHARCVEALERGIAAIRPGVVAGELDELVRAGLGYPHHSGHGCGTAMHEEPRIVPGGETVLEAGMVIALEPGAYPGPWGMRVERVVVVTEGGCETLSAHDLTLA